MTAGFDLPLVETAKWGKCGKRAGLFQEKSRKTGKEGYGAWLSNSLTQ
jgi:hypothetical protein